MQSSLIVKTLGTIYGKSFCAVGMDCCIRRRWVWNILHIYRAMTFFIITDLLHAHTSIHILSKSNHITHSRFDINKQKKRRTTREKVQVPWHI